MERQSEEELQIDVAATNMAITQAIGGFASISNDHRPFMLRILEAGLRGLDNADYRSISEERRAAFLTKVKTRYTEIITAEKVS